MRSVASRIVLFIAGAAIAPLLIYGAVSITSLRRGTEQSVGAGNLSVALQISERITQYFDSTRRMLNSVAGQVQGTQLELWQQQRVLQNHVLDFPEVRQLALFSPAGELVVSSRAVRSNLTVPTIESGAEAVFIAPPRLDADELPTTTMALPIGTGTDPDGWVVAEISLEELWRAVDRIRIGETGYALLLDESDRIIAHGQPDKKRLIASGVTELPEQQLARRLRAAGTVTDATRLTTANGVDVLAVAAAVRMPRWTVIIEQPRKEALAVALRLERQLTVAIGVALFATVVAGSLWGRSFIRRIFALTSVTDALAAGRMDARVALSGKDEIAQLGTQFNAMADRLVELQAEIRKQERQAMFGRIAAGLVHDLSHPIQTIGNSCKLIQRIFDDAEYRASFAKTVDRELATVKRLLEDLRNMARPIPLERVSIDVNAALSAAIQTMTPHVETAGLRLESDLSEDAAVIEADMFAMGRVYRNLILNAVQATAPGGLVAVRSVVTGDRVIVSVRDTGCGIPPERLNAIFEEFMTTKRRGLGLGLPISRRIVEQLGGRISVTSEVGKGTTFVIEFARSAARALPVAG